MTDWRSSREQDAFKSRDNVLWRENVLDRTRRSNSAVQIMRYFVGILVLVGLILGALILMSLRRAEPTYQAKPVSVWLDEWAGRKQTDHYAAIQEIGTNAIPYAVRNLERRDSVWRKNYGDTWRDLPKSLQKILPPPKPSLEVVDVANLFFYIGPPAIPNGIALLKHQSPSVRAAAAWGLGAVRRKSAQGSQAIPALIEALTDSDQQVCILAAVSLHDMGADASNGVPTLTRIVGDATADIGVGRRSGTTFALRANAARTLGKIGPGARNAIPTLKMAIETPDTYLRGNAAVAIWRITGEVDTALPVLIQEMALESEESKWDWIVALEEMGTQAQAAVPQLERELVQCKTKYVRQHITNALLKIDPAAAARVGVVNQSAKE